MDYLIAIVMLTPAICFVAMNSSWLVDYAFFIVAFNRGIRRLVDYYIYHEFTPLSPISLTPLIISIFLVIPFLMRFRTLTPRVRKIFWLLLAAIVHGFFVGFISNRFAAVFELFEYVAPIGLMGYVATADVKPEVMDRWIRSAGWSAVGVAAYGLFQYFNPPVWDAFWMAQVHFIGYLGIPEPTKIVVFSTMAERGTVASYLAAAAIPMIMASRWRNFAGWLSVALIITVIPLTYVRAAVIAILFVVVINPLINKGRGFVATLLFTGMVLLCMKYGISQLPTSDKLAARYETLTDMASDASFQGRLSIASYGWGLVKSHPLGYGFGATGLGGRVNTGALASNAVFGDNGYISLLLDYGWVGGLCFFMALWCIWKEISRRFNAGIHDEFMTLSRAWFLAVLILQYVANGLVGISLFWLFLGVVLSSRRDPTILKLLALRLRASSQKPPAFTPGMPALQQDAAHNQAI